MTDYTDLSKLQTVHTTPAIGGAAVTPNDSADMTYTARSLWVGTGGNVKVNTLDASTITLTNVPDGTLLPVQCKRVYSTGTTASGIVALW